MSTEALSDEQAPSSRRQLTVPRARVLVAEDDEDLLTMVAAGLRQDGHHIITVKDGVELLEYVASSMLFRETWPAPDIIVTDVRMPGFNGMNVLAGLRDEQWQTPIIIMTAYSDLETRLEAQRLGASAFFAKPFDLDDLRTAVLNLVTHQRPRRTPQRS